MTEDLLRSLFLMLQKLQVLEYELESFRKDLDGYAAKVREIVISGR